jgi:hypothetical protein
MGTPGPVQIEVKEPTQVTIVVTTHDGQKYDLDIAVLILGVLDQGIVNPLDGMPVFQVASQQFMQVKRHVDG